MNRTKQTYRASFRCYFPSKTGCNFATHFQDIPLSDIPKWIKAYEFTHPNCLSVCVKVWLTEQKSDDSMDED